MWVWGPTDTYAHSLPPTAVETGKHPLHTLLLLVRKMKRRTEVAPMEVLPGLR